VYYGTEQYLHNDTNGGGDPYNRLMMAGFDQTTAYTLITRLAALRHGNPALAYGSYRHITGLKTAMPAGTYHDYLRGLLTGTVRLVGQHGVAEAVHARQEPGRGMAVPDHRAVDTEDR
jgi:hypothetical protein